MPTYAKPEVPYEGNSDLYLATEWQVHSWVVLAGYDRGELTFAPGRITFRGMDTLVVCAGVSDIVLVRKTFPLVTVLAVLGAALTLTYAISPAPLASWRPPIPLVISIIIAASIMLARERWVEVIYDELGRERRAYFRRAAVLAWWQNESRTRDLYRELRRAVLPDMLSEDIKPSNHSTSR